MNGISGIGSMNQLHAFHGARRPDPEEMAQQLFAKLDSSDQGFIEKSDLLSAFQSVSSVSDTADLSSDDASLDELFTQLDSDGDGKVTEAEFTDSLMQIDEQINNLFSQMRMNEAMGMAPPPPPPPPEEMTGAEDVGFTKDELAAQLEEIGSSDETRSSLIENIIANFDEADSDGDGRVSMREAMAFDSTFSQTETDPEISEKVMLQIMRLMQAYNLGGDAQTDTSSTINLTA